MQAQSIHSQPVSRQRAQRVFKRFHGGSPFRTFLSLYRDDWGNLLTSFFFFVIKHSPVWVAPLVTANIIDIIGSDGARPVSGIWLNGAVLMLILLVHIPAAMMFMRYQSRVTRGVEAGLRAAIAQRIQILSISYYNRTSLGKLQAKALRDVEVIQLMTAQVFTTLPGALISITIALGVTALRAPGFLVFFLVTVPFVVLVMRLLRRPLADRNHDFRRQMELMSANFLEMLQLVPVTRAHAAEEDAVRSVEEKLDQVHDAGHQLDMMNNLFGAMAWVIFRLFDALCLITAAWLSYTQLVPISVGEVVLLTGYFAALTNSVQAITDIVPQLSKGMESIQSVGELLESPDLELNQGKARVSAVGGQFSFQDVAFAYAAGKHSVKGLSLEVSAGETLAIVGPSGAGKSTLLNLVIGFIRPTEGRILLDGRDMNALDLRTYRQFISVVPQETILLTGSVRDNVLYGLHVPPQEADPLVKQALVDANAWEFVAKLPHGVDTRIGEDGVRLSGGQRQRIAIARALVRNPRVLVLDEATSALDTESERAIQEALERLMRGRTTFVVAHRLSTIRHADRILVMEDGRIVESGSHEALMSASGSYARLVGLQMG